MAIYADDANLLEPVVDPRQSIIKLNNDLETLNAWSKQWLVLFNDKTKYMIISRKFLPIDYEPLFLDGKELKRVDNLKQLGVRLNEKMTWDTHIREKCVDANKRVNLLKRLSLKVPSSTKLTIYVSFVRPLLEYGSVVFDNCGDEWSWVCLC